MRLLTISIALIVAMKMLGGSLVSGHYVQTPMPEVLIDLDRQSEDVQITFIYEKLQDYIVTTHVDETTPWEAVRQVIGYYPLRATRRGSVIAIEPAYDTDTNITGRLVNEQGLGVDFANIAAYALPDTTYIGFGLSNESGEFVIPAAQGGEALLKINRLGYVPTTAEVNIGKVGNIVVNTNPESLNVVTVEGRLDPVKREIDRFVYNVAADPDAATSMLSEILRKVPLVSVDSKGKIRISGAQSFKIYKNGKLHQSYTATGGQSFQALPAALIESIEVITDPGVRDDADSNGMILNINFRKDIIIKGVAGTVRVWQDSNDNTPAGILYLDTQIKNVWLNLGGQFAGVRRPSLENHSKSEVTYDDTGNTLSASSANRSKGTSGWWIVDMGYDLNKNNFSLYLLLATNRDSKPPALPTTSSLRQRATRFIPIKTLSIIHPLRGMAIGWGKPIMSTKPIAKAKN